MGRLNRMMKSSGSSGSETLGDAVIDGIGALVGLLGLGVGSTLVGALGLGVGSTLVGALGLFVGVLGLFVGVLVLCTVLGFLVGIRETGRRVYEPLPFFFDFFLFFF